MEKLLTQLAPSQGEAVLLLGLHTEAINSYLPMFSAEGRPQTDITQGYRTLVLRTKDGNVELAAELPYLAVPGPRGFIFVGEASASFHEEPDPKDVNDIGDQRPHDYDATEIWTTKDKRATATVAAALKRRLERARVWGIENTEQIIFITPHAMCLSVTRTEWTGGALWFMGSTTTTLRSLGTKVDARLSSHVDDTQLRRFANRVLQASEDTPVDLDTPYEDPFQRDIDWRKDPVLCFDHVRGRTYLTGTVVRSGNSARSFSQYELVDVAPPSLAPSNNVATRFDVIQNAFPDALDAIQSPTSDVVLVIEKETLAAWDVLHRQGGQRFDLPGRIVMVEWGTGPAVSQWLSVLSPK